MMISGIGQEHATRYENPVGRLLRNGEYQVKAVVGRGGMGQVFLASHVAIDVPLALKQGRADQPLPESVINELDRILRGKSTTPYPPVEKSIEYEFPLSGGVHTDRFLREALLLARLQHPAIPALYDYFFEDGYWYLVMDYIPGRTLATHIRRHSPLPPLEAIDYTMQLCDVLDYLHKQTPPVVFRDLKPSNVILTPNGRLMLVDFGIARYFKPGQVNDTTDFGSPGYASPEQYQGTDQTDGRSDLFSLGVLLHEMVSGKRPVDIGGEIRQLESIHYLNPAISSVLSGLVNVATRSEPIYRFQSAHALYLALERAYKIEERRVYQQRVIKASAAAKEQEPIAPSTRSETTAQENNSDSVPTGPKREEGQGLLPSSEIHLRQRSLTQEALQRARNERLERERVEIHLASADESLKRRALLTLTPTPLPIIADGGTGQIQSRHYAEKMRRIRRISIIIAIILCLIVASLLIYGRFFHQFSPNIVLQNRTTPAVTLTPTFSVNVIPSSAWQSLPSLPSQEADNTAMYVQVNGKAYIYMTGGYRGTGSPHYDRGLYRYDIVAAHWEKVDVNNFPGMVNNAAALDEQNRLFYTVGYSPEQQTVVSLLYMYQPADGTLQKITPPTQNPIGFGGAMIADQQGHLYLTQGFMQAGNTHTTAGTGWYRYDISSGQWHTLAPLPTGLGYVILTPDGKGGILMFGGTTDAGQRLATTTIYRYDIAQNNWTQQLATAPQAFSAAAGCLNGSGQLLIIGGYDAVHDSSLNQVWLVNLSTLHWTALASIPSGGSVLGTAACDGLGHIYLVRGANSPTMPTADFWELSIK